MSSRVRFARRRIFSFLPVLWLAMIADVSGLGFGSRHVVSLMPARKCLTTTTMRQLSGTRRAQAHHNDGRKGLASSAIVTARYLSSKTAEGDGDGSMMRRWKFRSRDMSVVVVLIAAFLNLLGFTMAGPINPALGNHFSLPLGASFGSLSSAYPLGMMLGVFLWPALSDRIGRKPIMAASLMGSGLGLAVQSFGIHSGWGLKHFLATRVITGCFAGNSPVSKAFLADAGAAGGDLPKYLAWRDAAATLAFIIGPVLGGLLFNLSHQGIRAADAVANSRGISFVIGTSAVASIAASISVMTFVKETHDEEDGDEDCDRESVTNKDCGNKKVEGNKSNDFISCPLGTTLWTGVATVAAVSALYNAADSTFFAFFPSLLQQSLGFDTKSVGMIFSTFAITSFSISAFVSSRFIRTFGPVATCVTGLGVVGAALLSLGRSVSTTPLCSLAGAASPWSTAFVLGSAAMYYVGVPLYGPTIPTMLLQCVPPHQRGAVMGFDGTINTMARVVSPLLMGEIHRRMGAGACFTVAGMLVCGSALLTLSRRWIVLRKEFERSAAPIGVNK